MKRAFSVIALIALVLGLLLAVPTSVAADKPADKPAATQQETKPTEVESLKLQTLVQQRTILLQQQQILQAQFEKTQNELAALTNQAKETFEGVAKAHNLKMVFDPQTFQLVPAPEPKKDEPKGK